MESLASHVATACEHEDPPCYIDEQNKVKTAMCDAVTTLSKCTLHTGTTPTQWWKGIHRLQVKYLKSASLWVNTSKRNIIKSNLLIHIIMYEMTGFLVCFCLTVWTTGLIQNVYMCILLLKFSQSSSFCVKLFGI